MSTVTSLWALDSDFWGGVDWEDTVLFDGYRQQLEKTGKAQGHRNIKELVDYYKSNHDSLYRSLVTEGFKTGKWKEGISAIYVYIYKDGSFVSNSGGNHRLNMARVAGIKQVPVRIKGRHKDWQLLRDELFVLGTDKFLEKYPDLINHPDLFG